MTDEKIEQAPPLAAAEELKTDGSKTENNAPSSNTAAEDEGKVEEHKARPEREAQIKDLVVSAQNITACEQV